MLQLQETDGYFLYSSPCLDDLPCSMKMFLCSCAISWRLWYAWGGSMRCCSYNFQLGNLFQRSPFKLFSSRYLFRPKASLENWFDKCLNLPRNRLFRTTGINNMYPPGLLTRQG